MEIEDFAQLQLYFDLHLFFLITFTSFYNFVTESEFGCPALCSPLSCSYAVSPCRNFAVLGSPKGAVEVVRICDKDEVVPSFKRHMAAQMHSFILSGTLRCD